MSTQVKIRALSFHEPFASLIAYGKKTIETRYWKAKPGWFLVCAAQRRLSKEKEREWCRKYADVKLEMHYGKAVAIANISECREMIEADEEKACVGSYCGAFSWILENVIRINPFPVTGRQKWFDVFLSMEEVDEETLKIVRWW